MHIKKEWMFLPFGGGTGHPDEHQEHSHRSRAPWRRQKPTGDDEDLTKHESAAAFAAKDEDEIINDYNAPTRWWLEATLFPLIAGTFGPMASAFNICAVAIEWRLIVSTSSQESEGQKIPDPRWLVAINGVSLAIAIIANLALLGHMTGRIRFNISAPIVILGWYISGFILVALVAAAPSRLPLPSDPMAAYSQAYYYACFAGAIYILLSAILSVTAYGIWIGHYGSQFKLSLSQRSLMLQTMIFLGYVLAAAAVFTKVEGWLYLDSVYYIVVTLFTIGFGDLSPATHLGRSLYFPMSAAGIVSVGLIIANIRALVVESASVKISTRLVEKARFQALNSGNPAKGAVKIRGVMKRDMNADTELERREKEFNVMREIQKTATRNNRILALFMATLAFMILWFVGAVAFWKAEQGTGGQNWSYFNALYFAYTAQLTIGYGDFQPQTNACKPTFVFWALIALPTLTVLIGAIGDALAEFVTWGTEWIGKHGSTVLTFLVNALRGDIDARKAIRATVEKAEQAAEPESEGFDNIASVEKGRVISSHLSSNTFRNIQLDQAEEAYLPFVIIKAAQKVLEHMDEENPRKYSYEEWTWLLKLVGEDESTEEGHRTVGQLLSDDVEVATPLRSSKKQAWSWIGQESPLMDLEDDSEPKWMLKRLMETLERKLKDRGDQHVERRLETLPEESESGNGETKST